MTQIESKTIAIVDPRTLDGDPFEVAARAAAQAQGIARVLVQTIEAARIMARNAHMQRALQESDDPDAKGFEHGPQNARFSVAAQRAAEIEKAMKVLGQAAGYDPKRPVRA